MHFVMLVCRSEVMFFQKEHAKAFSVVGKEAEVIS